VSEVNTTELGIELISIETEMQKSYLDYAMSVIVSRALPDVRDGMKPVHRRILYTMKENGYDSTKPFRKSARIVGDVMGKYHPHGDTAIYDAMARMAQDFSLRLPLVNGQGNFGSMDGDKPAAMRYTEARLEKVSETLLDDIDRDTVDFVPNYDETLKEPSVLPAKFPNLLVNGAGGIAVGMATNIPSHNLGEVLNACIAYLDNHDISSDDLYNIVPAPDFPTGGIIVGTKGRYSASTTGRGSILMRARTHREEIGQKEAIIATEIPYQVNKSKLIERIAEVVKEGIVEGISDLRDESDRDGVRVVVELKRDAVYEVVLSNLFKHTQLQTSFGVNMLAINKGRPELMNLREVIKSFIEFREEVIIRRTSFELNKSRERADILAGLLVAIINIDAIIELIRSAKDPVVAKNQLMETKWNAGEVVKFIDLIDAEDHKVIDGKYNLFENQAKAILDLRLQRLTGMERDKLESETEEVAKRISELLDILYTRETRLDVMKEELIYIRDKFATPRKTDIDESEFEHDMEDLIQREDMVVTVTHSGYIKRVPLDTYRAQRRGGKGRIGMQTKEEDFVVKVFAENTHTPLLLFSSLGMCYKMKVYRLPLGNTYSKGKALINLLPLNQNETITAIMPLPEDESTWDNLFAMFATSKGTVRRNRLSDFVNIRSNGKIAMKLEEGDSLINVLTCSEDQDVMLASRQGMAIRFPVNAIRIFVGRNSVGVRGIKLKDGDSLVSMTILNHSDATSEQRGEYIRAVRAKLRINNTETENSAEDIKKAKLLEQPVYSDMMKNENFILTVSSNGYGQLASSCDYRVTNRGGKGIANMEMRNDNATITASYCIFPQDDEIILVTSGGQIIRTPTNSIRFTSRNSKGVKLFNIDGTDDSSVVSVAHLHDLVKDDEEDFQEVEITPNESNNENINSENESNNENIHSENEKSLIDND